MITTSLVRAKLLTLACIIFIACSSNEENSHSQLRRHNQSGEYIYRRHEERLFALNSPHMKEPPPYPWEDPNQSKWPKITKEHFRCKGSHLNPEQVVKNGSDIERYYDCGGADRHSLPLQEKKEFIYPILIELINEIQLQTGKKAVITSGHRCPTHNTYVDPSKENQTSKHQIGAEVNFYIQGLEQNPKKIIDLIFDYYNKDPRFNNDSAFTTILRYEKSTTNVSTPPWYNKEIFVKLFKADEGRNFDNRHPYPYISIQVRWDRDRNERVSYTWKKAHRNFMHL